MPDIIKYSFKSLLRHRLRSILILLSIGIGVASVVIISAIGTIGRSIVHSELLSIGMDSITLSKLYDDGISPLEISDLAAIRGDERVVSATGINYAYTELSMRKLIAKGVVIGVDTEAGQFMSMKTMFGRNISKADLSSGSRVCVVDQTVAEAFYKRENVVGKKIVLSLGKTKETFTVVGVVVSGGNMMQSLMQNSIPSFVYIPYTTMQAISSKSDFDRIALKLRTGEEKSDSSHGASEDSGVGEALVRVLENKNGVINGYKASNMSAQSETLDRMLNIVTLILSLIAGISLVVSSLGIMTIMLVSVNERTREIGIKKSIGASGGIIMLEFLSEALIISSIGSIVGALFGILGVFFSCLLFNITFIADFSTLFVLVAISIVVGSIFGVYPAVLASRLKPVEALRSN